MQLPRQAGPFLIIEARGVHEPPEIGADEPIGLILRTGSLGGPSRICYGQILDFPAGVDLSPLDPQNIGHRPVELRHRERPGPGEQEVPRVRVSDSVVDIR